MRYIITSPAGRTSAVECTRRTADRLRAAGYTVLPA